MSDDNGSPTDDCDDQNAFCGLCGCICGCLCSVSEEVEGGAPSKSITDEKAPTMTSRIMAMFGCAGDQKDSGTDTANNLPKSYNNPTGVDPTGVDPTGVGPLTMER